jgi:glutathionyl-hydroquinone reductase
MLLHALAATAAAACESLQHHCRTFDFTLPPQIRDAAFNLLHIKRHYYCSHPSLNALGIIPSGHPGESSAFSAPVPKYRLSLA